MKIATTTDNFLYYCDNDIDRIRELHRGGFRYIDLSMYFFTPDSPYMSDDWKAPVRALKEEADRLGLQFVQAHSQGGNYLKPDPEKAEFLVAATLRSIEICKELGIQNTVVHPGCAEGLTKEEWFEKNKAFYQRLIPMMEKTGVNVLIENSTTANTKGKYWANSGKDMVEFLNYVGHPLLHACWDTGHANCEGSQYQDILDLGKELYAIHYNDNHGERDEHLIPYLGTLNHDEVMHALIDADFKGYFTLECSSALLQPRRRREFSADTRLLKPQLFMQRHAEKLMYDTAKYILESYEVFEE